MAELQRLGEIKDLLNVPLPLGIGCKLLRGQIICLLVEHVQILSELEIRLLPSIVSLCFHEVIELIQDAWIPWINFDLKLY